METIKVNGVTSEVKNDCVTVPRWVGIRLRREIRKELKKFLTAKYQIN